MKKHFTLSIPAPCREKASSFTPTSRGAFCGSCQKEVIDFTSWNDERIIRHFSSATNTCGRFRSDQLKTYEEVKPKRARLQMLARVAVVTALSFFWQRPSFAQSRERQPTLTEQHLTQNQLTGKASAPDTIVVSGVVHDEDGTVLPGVTVIIRGMSNGTVTNASGEFKLTLTNPGGNETLVFSFIGMDTKEVPIAGLRDEKLRVAMRVDTIVMKNVVLGGMVSTRVYILHRFSPRRMLAKLKEVLTFKSKSSNERIKPATPTTSVVVQQKDIVAETEHRPVVCYPNPATDKLIINLPGPAHEAFISLSSVLGQVIEERISTKAEEEFDVSGLPGGIYVVKIEGPDGSRWIRVVKE